MLKGKFGLYDGDGKLVWSVPISYWNAGAENPPVICCALEDTDVKKLFKQTLPKEALIQIDSTSLRCKVSYERQR